MLSPTGLQTSRKCAPCPACRVERLCSFDMTSTAFRHPTQRPRCGGNPAVPGLDPSGLPQNPGLQPSAPPRAPSSSKLPLSSRRRSCHCRCHCWDVSPLQEGDSKLQIGNEIGVVIKSVESLHQAIPEDQPFGSSNTVPLQVLYQPATNRSICIWGVQGHFVLRGLLVGQVELLSYTTVCKIQPQKAQDSPRPGLLGSALSSQFTCLSCFYCEMLGIEARALWM